MAKLSLTIFFLVSIINLFYIPSKSCPLYQLEALLEFQFLLFNHSETSQRSNYKNQFWNSSISCCKWESITCSGGGTVTELVLGSTLIDDNSQAQMLITSEALSPFIRITSLTKLNFSGCGIRGKISGLGFANLSRLTILQLSRNKFEGFIPGEIFTSLRHLQHLSMSQNLLQGNIPDEIANLTELQYLSFNENKLLGEVPRSVFILKRLEVLKLEKNSLQVVFEGKAKELLDHLQSVIANEPKAVIRDQHIIEVKPHGVSKGLVVERLIEAIQSRGKTPYFVLCIGDD